VQDIANYQAGIDNAKKLIESAGSLLDLVGSGKLPETREDFAKLIQSIDVEVPGGAELYASLMDTTFLESIDDFYSYLEDALKSLDSQAIIAAHTLTDLEKGVKSINDWYEEQYAIIESVRGAMSPEDWAQHLTDLNLAASYQAQDLIDNWITLVTDAWKAFADELAFSDLAPVQSAEQYGLKLAELQAAAAGGGLEENKELIDYIRNEALPFYKSWTGEGPGYNAIYDELSGAGQTIKIDPGTISFDSDAMALAFYNALEDWAAAHPAESQNIVLDGVTLTQWIQNQINIGNITLP